MKTNKKVLFLLVILFIAFTAGKAFAVIACPDPFKIRQPDGKEFMARLFGDEWYSGIETVEGYTIFKEPSSGYWVYAKKTSSGELYPSDIVVVFDPPLGIQKHLRDEAAIQMIPSRRHPQTYPEYTTKGKKVNKGTILCLLVQFTDQKLVGSNAKDWKNRFFGKKNSGSVYDYYLKTSYSLLKLKKARETQGTKNDGIIIVTIDMKHPNTGRNTGDANRTVVSKALKAANKYINFKQYDLDKNGGISVDELSLIFVCSGYEASYDTLSTPNVWGHAWSLWGSVPGVTLDGVVVGAFAFGGGYQQIGEWHKRSWESPRVPQIGGHLATIGILCHELGHDLADLPDLYDTDYSSNGIGKWCLMSGGSWNTNKLSGDSPAHFSAWCKYFMGWINPTKLKQTSREMDALKKYSIKQIENNKKNSCYLLGTNPNGPEYGGKGEYFLIENRQKYGFDIGLPGAGLLIWHIDESKSTNTQEQNTKSSHRLVDLEQADGLTQLNKPAYNRGDTGDPFPGSTNNKKFTKTTNPKSKFYGGKNSKVQVTTISKSKKKMTAKLSKK